MKSKKPEKKSTKSAPKIAKTAQYDHLKIEKKWQKEWTKTGIYKTKEGGNKPKSYVLDMFPYPSGTGLHVGHPKGYIATDTYARYKTMSGFNVLHPMGWDAFGLPAEEFAIKNKIHPSIATKKNVKRYKEQLSILGFNYDWSREVNTTDPEYYKWTQWAFLQMHKKGLTFESHEPINWCPSCKTGLSNEDLEDGKCERCGSIVEQKPIRQWVIKITEYADRLLKDIDGLNWTESIKESQRNWIGRSEGAEIDFKIKGSDEKISVFTTRADTLFGVTYVVLAPEHKLAQKLIAQTSNQTEIQAFIESLKGKSDIERTAEGKEKNGVEIKGVTAINPANGEEIPVWIADYVLAGYGTGAVMAVPAHDERDFQFAKKYGLEIKRVIQPIIITVSSINDKNFDTTAEINKLELQYKNLEKPFLSMNGKIIDSNGFSGLYCEEARTEIAQKYGKLVTKYKLRDWVFSRQRYWGEPIPLIHCPSCGVVPVPEKELPLKLPNVKSYEPTGTGESPLAAIEKWVNVKCPVCKAPAKRETNTMPQWAGSCWYYLRFMDPKNKKALVDPKKEKYWQPVDMYVGGAEHATRHLIYARFWHKFLFDIGIVSTSEPFMSLKNQGLIAGPDGRKMSKRYGNVVNPDDIVNLYGADTLRVYEMFMGPFEAGIAWSTDNMIGSRRFIERAWRLAEKVELKKVTEKIGNSDSDLESLTHRTIKKVGEDIENFGQNTAISSLMILLNAFEKEVQEKGSLSRSYYETFLKLLAPFAPHVTDELWSMMGNNKTGKKSIHLAPWPTYDASKLQSNTFKIVVQINSKVRATLTLSDDTEAHVVAEATKLDDIAKRLGDTEPTKVIYVKGKLVNFVVPTV
ncbi:MAG: leucyl-tRNA synthetase [Patescibacteria group bacterium]|nr:leucyl-tRNA synthetase [Patescibacteria group bacterium]